MSADPAPTTLHETPIGAALMELAARAVEEIGTGLRDDAGETDGWLGEPVYVTETGVLGRHGAATTMTGPDVTIWVEDSLPANQRLRRVLDELAAHCLTGVAGESTR